MGTGSGLVKVLRKYFSVYGVPEELASDGGTVFTSGVVKEFLARFKVAHRVSSPHNPHSNQRAELGVRSMKRLCRENVSGDGSLDNDNILRGLLAYRNTPDQETGRSPACVLFGRQLREFLPVPLSMLTPSDRWRMLREDREKALAKRAVRCTERMERGSRELAPLGLGMTVRIQNMVGPHPKAWDNTGIVVEIGDYDQYTVKIHGSGRLLVRNRQFLRRVIPFGENLQNSDEQDSIAKPKLKPGLTFISSESESHTPAPEEIVKLTKGPELTLSDDRMVWQAPAPALENPQSVTLPESVTLSRAPEVRRSCRTVFQPDRLVINPLKKSYD